MGYGPLLSPDFAAIIANLRRNNFPGSAIATAPVVTPAKPLPLSPVVSTPLQNTLNSGMGPRGSNPGPNVFGRGPPIGATGRQAPPPPVMVTAPKPVAPPVPRMTVPVTVAPVLAPRAVPPLAVMQPLTPDHIVARVSPPQVFYETPVPVAPPIRQAAAPVKAVQSMPTVPVRASPPVMQVLPAIESRLQPGSPTVPPVSIYQSMNPPGLLATTTPPTLIDYSPAPMTANSALENTPAVTTGIKATIRPTNIDPAFFNQDSVAVDSTGAALAPGVIGAKPFPWLIVGLIAAGALILRK
jgi:hypothetical protein